VAISRCDETDAWLGPQRAPLIGFVLPLVNRRRRARPREVPLDENALPHADDGVDRPSDAWLLKAALDSLSPAHRAVISELFYHRRTVAEAAELLGVPEGTVRSRCFYGLRALRAALEKQGITRP
jgi:RNA polymerase sigma-70 factor, ECF subfamily